MRPPYMLQVPRSAWPDVQNLLDADKGELEKIVEYASQAQPLSDVEDLVEQCVTATDVTPGLAESVLTIIINIHRLMRGTESTNDKILDEFSRALEVGEFPAWEEKYSQVWNERKPLLAKLLEADNAVGTMSKARELLLASQCVLHQTALITDVRHIYNAEASDITGALVLHTLSLSYLEGGDIKEIHLTLSPKDVEVLSRQLQRANQKAAVSNVLLQKMEIPELTPKRNLQS